MKLSPHFSLNLIGGINPYEYIDCPVCSSRDFVSNDFSVVYCDKCFARFKSRSTAADPGVVIDCYLDEVILRFISNSDINIIVSTLFIDKILKPLLGEDYTNNFLKSLNDTSTFYNHSFPEIFDIQLCRVLKTGEYDSGWSCLTHDLCYPDQDSWFNWLYEKTPLTYLTMLYAAASLYKSG